MIESEVFHGADRLSRCRAVTSIAVRDNKVKNGRVGSK